jgi:hypothetical protein
MGNLFETVKESVTARDAAERYGLKLTRNGMACCPFHPDRHPSMKVDERYYCQRLAEWEEDYRPGSPEEEWHPLFAEALRQREYMEYLIEKLIQAAPQERQAMVEQLKGRVNELEQRFRGWSEYDGQ